MKGASNWLTTLPLQEENRTLNKSEFRDALAIRYGWRPKNLPQKCACGAETTIAHCLDCKLGGFVTMRHNQTRNTVARLLQKAGCKGVEIEQQLLPVEGELDGVKGVEKGDEARMDVTASQRLVFGVHGNERFSTLGSLIQLLQAMPKNQSTHFFKLTRKRRRESTTKEFSRLKKLLSHLLFSPPPADVAKNVI